MINLLGRKLNKDNEYDHRFVNPATKDGLLLWEQSSDEVKNMRSGIEDKDGNEWNKRKLNAWIRKGSVFSLAGGLFMAFIVGWVFLVPVAVAIFVIYGLVLYSAEIKNRITVYIKPTESMRAVVRRENELRQEKETMIHEEFHGEIKR